MSALHFVLVTETPLVRTGELFMLARALERNAGDCCAFWHVPMPGVDVIDDRTKLPPNCHPIVFVDDDGDPGTLAVHYPDITARVYVGRASGFNSGRYSVSEAAAHEVLEALIDPRCDRWTRHPKAERGNAGIEVAVEVCDPVQDTYMLDVDGTSWEVANFVTPRWFGLPAVPDQRLDRNGELLFPGDVGPEGYAILRAPAVDGPGFVTWFESRVGPQLGAHRKAAAQHPWSRTRKRGIAA